ncbi:MAG TPA: DUF4410 domain-containing protein [Candidatus Binataceae bacterium]|nr:DUF4410 domain-containing protein [Candidatus Binataceae bacterium]
MNRCGSTVLFLFAVGVLIGCASTKVTQVTPMVSPRLQRPNRIWVYDFIADPSKLPPNSSISSGVSEPSTPPTPEQLQQGRELGAAIAKDLVSDINAMGLTALQAGPGAAPQAGDGVLRGYLVSVERGSTAERFIIGFGKGASEMDTVVEGYAVTPQGWRKLGSGTLSSSSNKMPGMVAPAALAIATGSPIGVIVMGGAKIYGEASGRNTIEGRAKATSDAIAEQLKIRFRERGWIS